MRGAILEIDTEHTVAHRFGWIALGIDKTYKRFPKYILTHPGYQEGLRVDVSFSFGPYSEETDVIIPYPSRQLLATRYWDLLTPFGKTDPPGEKGDEIAPQIAKLKNTRTLEEKSPLFWKEEGKPGKVDLSRIHLGFSEVGVYRGAGFEISC